MNKKLKRLFIPLAGLWYMVTSEVDFNEMEDVVFLMAAIVQAIYICGFLYILKIGGVV